MSEFPISAKVSAEVGKKSTDKLIDAVVDAFSPATELLGALGDGVRLARVEMAALITRRAKAIADENGLQLTAPPLKFLIPFYERASSESEADTALQELWARLLVSAATNISINHNYFVDILSKITSEHANLFAKLMTSGNKIYTLDDVCHVYSSHWVDGLVLPVKNTEVTVEYLESQIEKYFYHQGVMATFASVDIVDNADSIEVTPGEYGPSAEDVSAALIALGVLRSVEKEVFYNGGQIEVTLIYCYLSDLGLEFWKAIQSSDDTMVTRVNPEGSESDGSDN